MTNSLLILFGKLISKFSQVLNLGNGSTWPGHIALSVNKNFIGDIIAKSNIKIVLIAGTNGKTTTAKLIRTVLEANGKQIIQNQSGANLLNGIASTLLLSTNSNGKLQKDFAIFEVDENTLPLLLKTITPDYIVVLNLFRDQLDRYGEVNAVAEKWQKSFGGLSNKTTLILNADDPAIAYLGNNLKINLRYFGCSDVPIHLYKNPANDYTVDSVYCPRCGKKLHFKSMTFSHLGNWKCMSCHVKRPEPDLIKFDYYPLPGLYNRYNTHAAVLLLRLLGFADKRIDTSLHSFTPAFGRQEELIIRGKHVRIFLSKNPASFNQSYATIKSLGAKTILFALNDRIPDGRDVSWIWDVNLEGLENFKKISIAGDRVYDMALRIKYEMKAQRGNDTKGQSFAEKMKTFENLEEAVKSAINQTDENETLFILPTYSAMLEVRKILTGKKIL